MPSIASAQSNGETLLAPPLPEEPVSTDEPTPDLVVHDGVSVYQPSYFAQFAPRNALDMLQNIPGFAVEGGGGGGFGGNRGNNARGLGEASGNILVNGERVSSKSTSTSDQLTRIPASNVVRIEVSDGATLDLPGLTGQVANIITKSTGSLAGRFELRTQYSSGPAPFRWGQGDISVTGSRGPVKFTIALQNPAFYGGSEGPNMIVSGAGVPDPRYSWQKSKMDRPTISGNFEIDLGGSTRSNINLSYDRGWFTSDEREYRLESSLPYLEENIHNDGDDYGYEIGGDIDFPLGAGRLKLIGLESYGHNDFSSQAITAIDDGSPDSGSRFVRASAEGERIGRLEYRWPLWGAEWQLSAEAAFNRLDNITALYLLNPAGEFIQIPFPAGTGGVREDRYEAIMSYSRPLGGNFALRFSGGAEYSKIAQIGANALSRQFTRPKGSINLSWSQGSGLDVSLEIARRVGQLSFGDFLANVNLSDDNTNGGNNQLRPEQSWDAKLEISKSLSRWGQARLTLIGRKITDYVTIVPLPGGGESAGNVPTASLYALDFNTTLKFDPVGFNGAKLDINLHLEHSSLKDPVTDEDRVFGSRRGRQLELEFRHDIPGSNWAWGGSFRATHFNPYYRTFEWGYDYTVDTFGALFIENKDVLGMTVSFRAANLFRREIVLQRTVYDGPRDMAPILFTEDRQREVGGIYQLTISGSF